MFEIPLKHNWFLNFHLDEKKFSNGMYFLDFQMLSQEPRNKRKKNGTVVRTLFWIRTVHMQIRWAD